MCERVCVERGVPHVNEPHTHILSLSHTHAHTSELLQNMIGNAPVALATTIPQHTATHCNALQHTATHCNTMQHTETHLSCCRICVEKRGSRSRNDHTATHCNTLQHTATRCNTPELPQNMSGNAPVAPETITLQHTATRCNTPPHTATHLSCCRI